MQGHRSCAKHMLFFFNSWELGDCSIAKVIDHDKLNTICWCSVLTHWGHSDLWLVLSGAHSLRAAISLVDSDPLGDHTQCASELCRQIMLPWKPILFLPAVFLCVWLHVFVCIFLLLAPKVLLDYLWPIITIQSHPTLPFVPIQKASLII